MTKRILILAVFLIAGLLLFEIVGLLSMKASLSSYARYWHRQSTRGEFTYVALGDSAAQGIGASSPERGYVGLLAHHIQITTRRSVRIVNLSVSGAKVADVTAKQVPQLKHYRPDLVTVEIGGNDVIHYDAPTFSRDYDALATALPPDSIVSNLPYFGGRIRRGSEVSAANQVVAAAARRHGLQMVDLYAKTKQDRSLLNNSYDLFHPSNRGYKNWEAAFWQVVEPTLGAPQRPVTSP